MLATEQASLLLMTQNMMYSITSFLKKNQLVHLLIL